MTTPLTPKVGELVPQARGGALRWGGTNRGGKGRVTTVWRRACVRLLGTAKALEVLREIISGGIVELVGTSRDGAPIVSATKNADRIKAIDLLVAQGYGLPTQHVEQDTQLTIRIVRE